MTNFDELCDDLDRRKQTTPVQGYVYLCSIAWDDRDASINDLITHWLAARYIKYLRDFNGIIWFLWDGSWTHCKYKYDNKTNIVHFSRCVY